MQKYRIVHFLPDPVSEARVPVAALVADGKGLSVAEAVQRPTLARPAEAAVRMILATLCEARSLESLPLSTGPQAMLGPIRDVPSGVSDATEWVRSYVLPHSQATPTTATRSSRPSTLGFRFFERHQVEQFVHRKFRPSHSWAEFPLGSTRALTPVSHWVGSPTSNLLLMEPLVPNRVNDHDLAAIYGRLAGYRVFLDQNKGDLTSKTRLCVYLLPGGQPDLRGTLEKDFSGLRASIVDTEDDFQRVEFLRQIETVGMEAKGQPALATGAGIN